MDNNIVSSDDFGESFIITSDTDVHFKESIKLVKHEEFLEKFGAIYDEKWGYDFDRYLNHCLKSFISNEIDFNRILWKTTTDKNFGISDVVEECIRNNYNVVIVEYIEEGEQP